MNDMLEQLEEHQAAVRLDLLKRWGYRLGEASPEIEARADAVLTKYWKRETTLRAWGFEPEFVGEVIWRADIEGWTS